MILGADDRVTVADTTAPPYGSVARVTVAFSGFQPITATGFVIGPNDVLVAAHEIYIPEGGGFPASITVAPAASGNVQPYGAIPAVSVRVLPAYPGLVAAGRNEDLPLDLALVTLATPTSAPALPLATPADPVGLAVVTAGYPIDRGGSVMFSAPGSVASMTSDYLRLGGVDVADGQSGSPIIAGGSVIGVITFETNQGNFGVRFDQGWLSTLIGWASTNDQTEGPDVIEGGPWAEAWSGLGGNDLILGMDGNDTLAGGAGDDDLNGNRGVDVVHGDVGADFVRGGQGDDTVYGDDGDDWHVNGNIGDDYVYGGDGADRLYGGPGSDYLSGGPGGDTLSGDLGNDTLAGGPGSDLFVFSPTSGADVVDDFDAHDGDRIGVVGVYSIIAEGSGSLVVLENGGSVLMPLVKVEELTPDLFLAL